MLRFHVALAAWLLPLFARAAPPRAVDAVLLEVRAGAHDRRSTPVRAALPAGWEAGTPCGLARDGTDKEIPVQVMPGAAEGSAIALWILDEPLPAGQARRYRLQPRPPARPAAGIECAAETGKYLQFRAGGKDILRYNDGVVAPPAPIEPLFGRSGYIHPLCSPAGAVVSNDHPPKHKHHHGIWFPWTSTTFEGRKVDFWNTAKKQGAVECEGVDARFAGPAAGGFRARHRFVDLTSPGGPKEALKEIWEVTVYDVPGCRLFDLTSTQTCAGSSPLILEKYYYGGIGFRGAGAWEGKNGVAYLTSEGKARIDGNAQPARWCRMAGTVDGSTRSIVIYCHPANFRAPQAMRLHPDEPFMCFCPTVKEGFSIEPGRPYLSRYRFSVHDGEVSVDEIERLWKDYAKPPEAGITRD